RRKPRACRRCTASKSSRLPPLLQGGAIPCGLERVMQVHRPLRIGAAATAVAGAVVVDLQPRLQRQARLQQDVDAEGLAHEGVVAAGFHAYALVDLAPVAEALRQ